MRTLLRRDLRHWLPASKTEGILVIFLFFLFFVMQEHELQLYQKTFPDTIVSLGDSLCAWLYGIPVLRFGDVNQMQLPVRWILLFMGGAVFSLRYPHFDYTHYRMQIFLRTDNRQDWWSAKLICGIILVMLYYLIFLAGCFLLIHRYGPSGKSLVPRSELWGHGLRTFGTLSAEVEMILLPGIAIIAFFIITMTLSTFLNVAAALAIDFGILIIGCFVSTPLFFPSSVLYVRNDYFVGGSLWHGTMVLLAAVASIFICDLIGRWMIRRAEC